MNPLTYLHLQMRLEWKELVNEHFMRQVEVVPDEEMPLMLIAQLENKELAVYYDEAISPDLQKELAANIFDIEYPKLDLLVNVLKSHNINYEVGDYKTYVFPLRPVKDMSVICLAKHDPKVQAFRSDGFAENIYAIERDGSIVSAAFPHVRMRGEARHGCIQTLRIAIRDSHKSSQYMGNKFD